MSANFGFSSVNGNDEVIASTEDMTLRLIAQGTVRSSNSTAVPGATPYGDPGYRIVVPQPANTEENKCLVFIQPLTRSVGADGRSRKTGVVNPFYYITNTRYALFKYLIFYPTNQGLYEHQEQWGIELYNAEGTKTFSSNQEIMEITGVTLKEGANWYDDYLLTHAYTLSAFYCLHMGAIRERFATYAPDDPSGVVYRQCIRQASPTSINIGVYAAFCVAHDSNLEYWDPYVDYGGVFGMLGTLVMKDPLLT